MSTSTTDYTASEMMIIAAARQLNNDDVCLVGIGMPSTACNLARLTHAPHIQLIYESGTIASQPDVLPLSIGDPELCESALTTVSLAEMFRYWLQGGRITTGFLGAAQIDRYANLNSTVIGDYHKPKVRLPGAGGAPEIATGCQRVFVILPMTSRHFVEKLAFRTSLGHGEGTAAGGRKAYGVTTEGPRTVITDKCILRIDPETGELVVASLHENVTREQIEAECNWPIRFADKLDQTPPPTDHELNVLRDLLKRTEEAHAKDS